MNDLLDLENEIGELLATMRENERMALDEVGETVQHLEDIVTRR